MFRAVDKTNLKDPVVVGGKSRYFVEGRSTLRPPSNVPWAVDNLWELYRSRHLPFAPSRRESAFASPTQEQALKSAVSDNTHAYKVVLPDESPPVAVLCGFLDAKFHPDIKQLIKRINAVVTNHDEYAKIDACKVELFSPLGFHRETVHSYQSEYILGFLSEKHMWTSVLLAHSSDVHTLREKFPECEIWFDQRKGYWLEEL